MPLTDDPILGMYLAAWENGYLNALMDIMKQLNQGNKDIAKFISELNAQVPYLAIEVYYRDHPKQLRRP